MWGWEFATTDWQEQCSCCCCAERRDLYSQKLIISFKSKPVSATTFISGAAGFQDSCPHILPVMSQNKDFTFGSGCHLPCGSVTSETRDAPAAWHPQAEQNRAGGALKSSGVGPDNDSIGFLWLCWSSANFLFFTSVRGRAELGQRWECSSGALDMVLADAWMGIAVQSGLFYKHEFQKWKMTKFYAWTLLRLFICIFSLVCPVRFCVFDVKSLWDVWGKTWEYSKVVYFEQQMHPK